MPDQEETVPQNFVEELLDALQLLGLSKGLAKADFYVVKGPKAQSEPKEAILGPKIHYILVEPSPIGIQIGSAKVRIWTTEYKNGHHPDYPGYEKHRVLPEQFDWLNNHKNCDIRAWYDVDMPGFISMCCNDHKVIIHPVVKDALKVEATDPDCDMENNSLTVKTEDISTEEREI